jgi:hypothetical protein
MSKTKLDADGNIAPHRVQHDKTSPTRNLSADHKMKMAEVAEQRKDEALSEDHVIKLHYGYKKQKDLWINANEEDRHAIVFGMVLFDGAIKKGMADIARFFAIKGDALKELQEKYAETFEMAAMALKLKIQRNVISLGLQREDAMNLKFNLLLQYSEQVLSPVHEGVESMDEGKEITINVISTKEQAEAAANGDPIPNMAVGPKGTRLQ